jgi:uncharacterized protein YhfF
MADELGDLVVRGIKTATAGSEFQEDAPELGRRDIVLDGKGKPLCVIETTDVTTERFNEVDFDFAKLEGEGFQTIENWREAHRDFFKRVLKSKNKEFSEDMLVVCEKFRLLHIF